MKSQTDEEQSFMWVLECETHLIQSCFTPTEAQHRRLGLLLTRTTGNLREEVTFGQCHNQIRLISWMFSTIYHVFVTRWSFDSLIELSPSVIMDLPLPMSQQDIDVDLGFALFFLVLLCLFLLVTMVRCAQMVLDPYSAISESTYQEEQEEEWRLKQADWEPL